MAEAPSKGGGGAIREKWTSNTWEVQSALECHVVFKVAATVADFQPLVEQLPTLFLKLRMVSRNTVVIQSNVIRTASHIQSWGKSFNLCIFLYKRRTLPDNSG